MNYNFMVPYRNRPNSFGNIHNIYNYLNSQDYLSGFNLIVVEQSDDGRPFNLGKLINVGFDVYDKNLIDNTYNDEDSFCFLPVDHVLVDIDFKIGDYDFVGFLNKNNPTNIYAKAFQYNSGFFKKINGFCNEYWGWGKEDEDMLLRLGLNSAKSINKPCDIRDLSYELNEGPSIENHDANLSKNSEILSHAMENLNNGLNSLSYNIVNTRLESKIKILTVEI